MKGGAPRNRTASRNADASPPALEDVVRQVVREELRRMLARLLDDEPRDYSSRRGCGPAGYSARAWKALARRIGTRRGRWYVVTRAQLEAHEAKHGAPEPPPTVAPAANDVTWSPTAALARAGLRRSGT